MAELKMYTKEIEQIPDLKNEIHNLNKELIEEKLKVKGLSEELENPMNVHRWRKL
jgi:ribosomal protein L29